MHDEVQKKKMTENFESHKRNKQLKLLNETYFAPYLAELNFIVGIILHD